MCELAIVIHFSVYHKHANKHPYHESEQEKMHKAENTVKRFRCFINTSLVLCLIGSVASMACGIYLMVILSRYCDLDNYEFASIYAFWFGDDPTSKQWFS